MATQTKGKCKYCGKEYTRAYMFRHLSACKERKSRLEGETGKRKCGYFLLSIYGRYDQDYWLMVEIKETATLGDLDVFLRNIWLECCGHLSAFYIGGECYESYVDPDPFWGRRSMGMNYKLKTVFQKNMAIGYQYDFGSTTELVIEVKDYRSGYDRKEKIVILSRNNPETFLCRECKEKAVYVVPRFAYDGNPFLCEKCSELEEYEEEYMLRVCNSPRMGVCGYDGSDIYQDQFVPDSEA